MQKQYWKNNFAITNIYIIHYIKLHHEEDDNLVPDHVEISVLDGGSEVKEKVSIIHVSILVTSPELYRRRQHELRVAMCLNQGTLWAICEGFSSPAINKTNRGQEGDDEMQSSHPEFKSNNNLFDQRFNGFWLTVTETWIDKNWICYSCVW